MLRTLLGGLMLFAVVGYVAAEEADKKAQTKVGRFSKYVADTGKLTVLVGKKDEAKPMDFDVAKDFKVTVIDGDNKSEKTAADAFKDAKENMTRVAVTVEENKVTKVDVGGGKKK